MPHTHDQEKEQARTLTRIIVTLTSLLRERLGLLPDPNLSQPYPVAPEIAINFLHNFLEQQEETVDTTELEETEQ